VTCM